MNASEVARRQKDVKLRSTLSDSQLTPDLLAKRQYAKRLQQPVVSGSALTFGDLVRDRRAASDLRYGEQQGSLEAQQPRDAGWFDQYLQTVRAGQDAQKAQAAQVAQQIQGFGDAGVQASRGMAAQTLAPLQAQASQLGAQVDPGLQGVADQASLVRQALVNSFGANASANSLAQGDVLRGREQGGVLAKIDHGTELGNRLRALLREKGAFADQFTSDYKDNAQKTVLENQAFGLNQDKFDASLDNTAADNARADEALNLNKAKDAYQRKNKLGPYKPATGKVEKPKTAAQLNAIAFEEKYGIKPASTSQHTTAKNTVGTSLAFVKELKAAGWKRPQIAAELLKGIPANTEEGTRAYPKQQELWLSVALDQAFLGRISDGTAVKLHKAGYSVKQLGL